MPKFYKYGIIFALLLCLAGGFLFFSSNRGQTHLPIAPQNNGSPPSGAVIFMRTKKDMWKFEPNELEVKKDVPVSLRIFNEDDYEHGFDIPEMGVNELLPPGKETIIRFVPAKSGIYGFNCSVPCGKSHYLMTGKIKVI